MNSLHIANVIREQINYGVGVDGSSGMICSMAWGANRFTGCGEETEEHQGWLSFQVRGRKFKGAVKIKLLWNDTYRVEFWKVRRPSIKMVHAVEDVYFDQLTSLIDRYVEAD